MDISKSLPVTEWEASARIAARLPQLLEGLSVTKVSREARVGDLRADLVATVRVGSKSKKLVMEVKRIGEPRFAKEAIFQLLSLTKALPDAYPVLAAPYLTESVRKLCKESGVGYLDLVGNVFLRFNNVLIERSTPEAIRQDRKALRGLSPPKTSRVVRTLLGNPKLPFRVTELAQASRVSPAEAYKVANLLELKGFARRDPEKRVVLTNPGELLQAWANAVEFKKNQIVPAYSLERTPEAIVKALDKVATSAGRAYALTMFAGASLVAPSVRFYDVTSYIDGDIEWWMKQLGVKQVESGSNLQLVVPRDDGVLKGVQTIDGFRVVSKIQLYADLYNNPARGRDQAEMVRKKIGF
jgi:hypothetical protein